MPEEIQDVIKRVSEGCYSVADLQAISEAVEAEQVTVVSGNSAVGIGGDAENTTIVTGSSNITGNHFEIHLHGVQEELYKIVQQSEKRTVQEEALEILDINGIHAINASLQSLKKLSETEQFSQAQDEQLSSLKQQIKSLGQELKDIYRNSQTLSEEIYQHLKKKLEDLYIERQKQFDTIDADSQNQLLNEEIQQARRAVKEFERLKKSFVNYQKVANCLDDNRSHFAARAAEEALKIYSQVKDAASEQQIDNFKFSIEQFLEQITHCLKLEETTILDSPGIPLEFDKNIYVYEAAFQFMKEMIPSHLPTEGIKKCRRYVDYLISRLRYY